jgi:hypothetical protein
MTELWELLPQIGVMRKMLDNMDETIKSYDEGRNVYLSMLSPTEIVTKQNAEQKAIIDEQQQLIDKLKTEIYESKNKPKKKYIIF